MEREVIMRFNGFSRDRNEPILEHVGELVRCKDCKFSVKDEYNIYHGSEISNRCIAMGAVVSPDDYCSWAERRDHETD